MQHSGQTSWPETAPGPQVFPEKASYTEHQRALTRSDLTRASVLLHHNWLSRQPGPRSRSNTPVVWLHNKSQGHIQTTGSWVRHPDGGGLGAEQAEPRPPLPSLVPSAAAEPPHKATAPAGGRAAGSSQKEQHLRLKAAVQVFLQQILEDRVKQGSEPLC